MRGVCSCRCGEPMGGPARSGRRRLVRVLVACVLMAGLPPASASADGLLTPFLGMSFGDQTERMTTYGFSLAGMAGGIFGLELDVARTAEAQTNTLIAADGRVTTVNGNIIVGVPLVVVRPYAVGGLGWMRTRLTTGDDGSSSEQSDGLALAVGGGLIGFFGDHLGLRADLRYVRALTASGSFFDFDFDSVSFTRVTGGLVLRF